MTANLALGVICVVGGVALLAPWLRSLSQRIRAHDERARMNRRCREIDEAKWKDLERCADLRAGMHRKLTGGA